MKSETPRTEPGPEKIERRGAEAEENRLETAETAAPVAAEADEKEKYSLAEAADNAMVGRYRPKFLTKGGEHVVYELPDRPGVVIKVDARVIERIQRWNADHGLTLDAMDPELLPHVEEFLKDHRERLRILTKYFGIDKVPRTHEALVKVPVTPSIVNEIHRGSPPAGWEKAAETWAIVRVQRRLPELSSPDRRSVVGGYAEFRQPDRGAYARVTAALLEGKKSEYTKGEFASLFPEEFGKLLDDAESDPRLREVLKDFVERTAKYAAETGEILDLAGGDNVSVFKDGENWRYRLVDALYPGKGEDVTERARLALLKAARGEALDEGEKNAVLNTINFARTVNGLAEHIGSDARVDVIPEEARGKIDYLELVKQGRGQKR